MNFTVNLNLIVLLLLLTSIAFAADSPPQYEITQVASSCLVRVWNGKKWEAADALALQVGETLAGTPAAKQAKFLTLSKDKKRYSILAECAKPIGLKPPAAEGVDLAALDAEGTAGGATDPNAANAAANGKAPHGGPAANDPHFRLYFDFALYSRPGIAPLTFDSFHNLVMVELMPTPDIQFSFELSQVPKYFELDYKINQKLQLRVGKIWIPFDDMSPHNIFGGRVNVSKLSDSAFLPDLWTDLGVGFRYQLMDTAAMSGVADVYAVNGFRDGGTDPKSGVAGTPYPSFKDAPTSADNNSDKGLGARLHLQFMRRFGVGLSLYTAQWSPESDPVTSRLTIIGNDGQLRLGNTEFRAGYALMKVSMPANEDFTRAGAYVEASQRFGSRNQWKGLFRGGQIQLDNRVIDVTDQVIVGGTILYDVNTMLQLSFEHSRDLLVRTNKLNYFFTALRLVMAF